jgi:hypothetical protein
VAGFQGSSREPKAAETYLGSWGLVLVLTASEESKVLRARSLSSAWIIFLGSPRTRKRLGQGASAGVGRKIGSKRGVMRLRKSCARGTEIEQHRFLRSKSWSCASFGHSAITEYLFRMGP